MTTPRQPRRMMGPLDLSYILLADNTKGILARVTAWNKLCEQRDKADGRALRVAIPHPPLKKFER